MLILIVKIKKIYVVHLTIGFLLYKVIIYNSFHKHKHFPVLQYLLSLMFCYTNPKKLLPLSNFYIKIWQMTLPRLLKSSVLQFTYMPHQTLSTLKVFSTANVVEGVRGFPQSCACGWAAQINISRYTTTPFFPQSLTQFSFQLVALCQTSKQLRISFTIL